MEILGGSKVLGGCFGGGMLLSVKFSRLSGGVVRDEKAFVGDCHEWLRKSLVGVSLFGGICLRRKRLTVFLS